MMRAIFLALGLAMALPVAMVVTAEKAEAQSAVRSERVTFKPGQSSAVVTRTIRGRETVDFLVNARQGQKLEISMRTSNSSAYFNLIAPGDGDVAFYAGDRSSPLNTFSGTMIRSGDLKVRVYLYRAAARRGERANITLSIAVHGSGGSATQLPGHAPGHGGHATQLPHDALVAGTDFHAVGQVLCSFNGAAPTRHCAAGVRRRASADGTTFVEITRPNGNPRVFFFQGTRAYGADSAQADGSASYRFHATRSFDQTTIEFGPERYVIPDALVVGG